MVAIIWLKMLNDLWLKHNKNKYEKWQSLLLLFLFLNLFHGKAQEEIKILSPTYEFSQGSTEYLFANKVKLREAPSKTAKVIELLPAGSEVTILEKL